MKNKIILVLSIIIIVLISIIICITNKKQKNYPAETIIIEKEKEEKKKTEPDWDAENILLLGDSITEIYPEKEIFGNLPIIKSGVSGYTTNDILNQMNSMVYQYNPTKVFLLIGTNDIMYETDQEKIESVVNNIKEIVQRIKKNRKNAKIYIESIFPVNRNMKKDMVLDRKNETIIEINSLIKKYCTENSITYIDLYNELTDRDGNFDEQYTYDGLHPSTLGYAKISQILAKYIYETK